MVKTIREIIDMMEDAADNDDFGGLYAAAKEIKDASLREEVESAIAEYEESDTPVDETYSIVTSDYLDYYMYEDNTENLTEGKKITEGIDDKVYEVADRIAKSIQESGVDRISMEELNEMISNSCEELGVKEYDDLEADVRGILSYRGYETDFETGEIIALEESIDVEHAKKWAKNMDKAKEKGEFDIDHASAEGAAYSDKKTEGRKKISPEDEAHFNDEIDKVARQEIEDKLKNDKKEPDEEIEKELDKVEEDKSMNPSDICNWVKNSIDALVDESATCCEYKLDSDLSIFCGWSDGFDEDEEEAIHSKEEPSWCICVGIKSNHEYMKTDFDMLTMPYEEDGEVWDTSMTVGEDGISESDAQWYIDQYNEIRKSLDAGEIMLESKKEEGIETRELVSFDEIDNMMYNATDYADLYEASSYIENNSLRVDVENLIGQCEDDGDDVEVAYSVVTSDLLDMYSNDENVAELKVMNKVTEGADTLDNSDEEDLATLLFTEAFEGCSIDKDGKADYYELQTLEEIRDWYDESVTEELYSKAKRIVEKVLNEVKFYKDSESHDTYIELNDNHTLWEIEIPEDINNDEFDMVYSDIVTVTAGDFEEETGTKLYLVGRMGRHACVEANLQNALRYNELKEVQEKLEKEVISKANAYLNGEGLDESKKITESKSDYSEMLSFATQLASALKSKGFKVKVNGEDNYVNINPVRDGAEMGVTVYLGEENGQFDFEENTVGLGGDTISDNTVYPIYVSGWDYEIGAPSGSPKVGEEVYAVFKETANTTVDEVVEIIEKSFDTEGPVNESKKITESEEVDMDTFIGNLETALKDNGYTANLVDVDGEGGIYDLSPRKGKYALGLMIYKGGEDSSAGFEEDTVGLGGDGDDEVVYPIYIDGWDDETATPMGKAIPGKEVYAMFKEINNVTIDEVIDAINKSFEAVMNKGEKVTESKSIVDEFKDYCNDLGINPDKKSSINRFLGDYGKNYVSRDGVASFDTEMAKVEKELKAGLNK